MSILRTLCRPFRALLPGHSGRRNEAHWRSLMQNSLDVVLIVGPDGTIQYQSPSVEWIFGYAPGQLVGRQLADWAHPDDAPRVAAYLAEAAPKRGLAGPEEWRLRHRDGSWLAVETVGANFGHDPSVRGVVLNIRDV